MKPPNSSPSTIEMLIQQANVVAGLTLGELATAANIRIPENFKREKGWSGQLLELWLGASAGSKQAQDFPNLGIELKTLPVDNTGQPLETTYVCYAPLLNVSGTRWQQSSVFNKLQHVLWVPVQGDRTIAPKDRIVGTPFLWRPNDQQLRVLEQDWEDIMEMICFGKVQQLNARIGEYLHVRPKAANGKALTDAIGENGQITSTRPRGFYLRKSFTQQLLRQAF